jgi:hypothetical protein
VRDWKDGRHASAGVFHQLYVELCLDGAAAPDEIDERSSCRIVRIALLRRLA